VRRLYGRGYVLSVTGSLIVHAGIAACFLTQPPDATRPAGAKGAEAQQAVEVSIVRATPLADVQVDPPSVRLEPPSISAPRTIKTAEAARPEIGDAPGAAPVVDGAPRTEAPDTGQAATAMKSPSTPALAAVGLDYQRRLLEHIEPFRRYPEAANRGGVRGTVELMFEIDRAGRVLGVWVMRSSGSDLLDLAAIETVRRAAPLPPIPPQLPDQVTVSLPVTFNLKG
jgi:periplasmic protein TonB